MGFLRLSLPFFLLTLSACSSAPKTRDLLVPEDVKLDPPATLSSSEISADLSHLKAGLKKGYIGLHTDVGTPNLNIDEFSLTGNESPELVCSKIDRFLLQAPDATITAILDGKSCAPERVTKVEAEEVIGRNLGAPKNPKNESVFWSRKDEVLGGRLIVIFGISDFRVAEDPGWRNYVSELKTAVKDADAIVLDLRGNHGGPEGALSSTSEILAGGRCPTPIKEVRTLQTPEALALRLNYFRLRASERAEANGSKNIPDHYFQAFRSNLENLEKSERGEIPEISIEPTIETPAPPSPFSRPVVFLVDQGCRSSCERFLESLEFLPSRILIGRKTAGRIHFSHPGSLVLPNSRIIIEIPTKQAVFKDERNVEGEGYRPLIQVPEGTDALKVALTFLKKKLSEVEQN